MSTPRLSAAWAQLPAATDYLAATQRPGFEVADAIEEALRHWTDAYLEPLTVGHGDHREVPWDDPDPLRTTIERLLAVVPPAGAFDGVAFTELLTAAVEAWITRMATHLNDGRAFTAPAPGIPGPLMTDDEILPDPDRE